MRRQQNQKNDEWPRGLYVEVKNNDIGRALRKFKKKVQDDGILQEVRAKEYYEKPSIRKKRAKAAARARHLKKIQKEQDI